jgi:glutamate-1-semialdehyde aminotransferase
MTIVSDYDAATRYRASRELDLRARKVIPGGGHLSGRPLVDTETTPLYFQRAQGCRIWDVDGNEYIDYLLAFGAYLLGYAHPEVEHAAREQAQNGRLLSLNHPRHVEFIEALLPRFPGAEMGVFFRTGSEATTAALRIARRATGRRRVVRCGYHGWHDWCVPREDFVPLGLDEQVLEFSANDPSSLEPIFARHPQEIAAVILAPEMVLPHRPTVFHEVARITRSHGAAFIMDEVKTGVRIDPGSVSARIGLVPDLLTVSKALGSGFMVAAVLGRRAIMEAGNGMHYSGTLHGDTAAMAAALKTLQVVEEQGVRSHVFKLGEILIAGLNTIAEEEGVPARAYGEPLAPMPFLRFEHADAEIQKNMITAFYREVLAQGILLHPRHMWFLSAAHTFQDVARTLEAARLAMRVAREALRHA